MSINQLKVLSYVYITELCAIEKSAGKAAHPFNELHFKALVHSVVVSYFAFGNGILLKTAN